MPAVRDLVARVGDALKQSEFRNHADLYRMDQNLSELRRIQWCMGHSIVHCSREYGAYHRPHGPKLKAQDLAVYRNTLALLRKLKVKFSTPQSLQDLLKVA